MIRKTCSDLGLQQTNILHSVENILNEAALLRAQVGNGSDIIAVVPRGVGSTFPPITCDTSDLASMRTLWEIQGTLPGYTPRSSLESYTIGQNLGLDCGLVTPDLIPYVGTVYVAHDMDFVRQALGLEKLSYLGYSYGSVLGGTYAALFPDKVGSMVLDGVLDFNDYYSSDKDPALDIGDADLALHNFFQACYDAGLDACALWANTTKEIENLFVEADQRLFDGPLPVPGHGLLKWPLWQSGVYNALYSPARGFPPLAGVASEILDGAAGPYIEAYMDLVQISPSPAETYLVDSKTGIRNSPNAGSLISCSDAGAQSNDLSSKELDATFTKYQSVSHFFAGVSSRFVFICSGVKLSAKKRYTDPFRNIVTANPILFVGNTADPTTPIRNAHRMSEAFPGSRVLTVRGTGHISYNAAGDTRCATEWITPFFRDGTLPPNGTVCDGNQSPFASSDD
jgi:pimeloyl-ACP methyl ester carboxylesterase